MDDSLACSFTHNAELAAKAFVGQIELLSQMKKLLITQRTLVEAANASPYGWNAANKMEEEHGIFSLEDQTNTKALCEAEMAVRWDTREFKARRGNISNRGGRGGKRTRWDSSIQETPVQVQQALND